LHIDHRSLRIHWLLRHPRTHHLSLHTTIRHGRRKRTRMPLEAMNLALWHPVPGRPRLRASPLVPPSRPPASVFSIRTA
jgi:hypothetical protein